MTDPAAFLVAAFVLLAVPGPTNALLATSGAVAGFRRSAPLVAAAMIGYGLSVSALALAVAPFVRHQPLVGVGLRLACALTLMHIAWRLWGAPDMLPTSPAARARPVRFAQMLTTTLFNPKAVVLAFGILPHLADGDVGRALPYCLAGLALIAVSGGAWIGLGALIQASLGARLGPRLVQRLGAMTLVVFALIVSGTAFATLPQMLAE